MVFRQLTNMVALRASPLVAAFLWVGFGTFGTLLIAVGCRVFKASAEVAFMGDSITEGWAYPRDNFGVYGNTTAQMVARFPAQVPGHHFKRVVILGGTNDVLLGIAPADTVDNLRKMANLTIQ